MVWLCSYLLSCKKNHKLDATSRLMFYLDLSSRYHPLMSRSNHYSNNIFKDMWMPMNIIGLSCHLGQSLLTTTMFPSPPINHHSRQSIDQPWLIAVHPLVYYCCGYLSKYSRHQYKNLRFTRMWGSLLLRPRAVLTIIIGQGPKIAFGDRVWLSTKNIYLKALSCKLAL